MPQYIALFRGINVGGKNILPMAELRELMSRLGLKNVATYIQSGNAVFHTAHSDLNIVSGLIQDSIKKQFGFAPNTLILSIDAFREAMANNPFPDGPSEPKTLHLYFLAEPAHTIDWEGINGLKADSEAVALTGDVFYLYAPKGIGRSKLAAKVEKLLGVPATARNWRSVVKIEALANRNA